MTEIKQTPEVHIDVTQALEGVVVTIDEPTEWVDRSLSTASWWDRYEIQTGSYVVRFTSISGAPFVPHMLEPDPGRFVPERAYYATWMVDALLLEEYRVSSLFQHSTASTTKTRKRTTVTFQAYAYEVEGFLIAGKPGGRPGRVHLES